jgi:hypothetical protein
MVPSFSIMIEALMLHKQRQSLMEYEYPMIPTRRISKQVGSRVFACPNIKGLNVGLVKEKVNEETAYPVSEGARIRKILEKHKCYLS